MVAAAVIGSLTIGTLVGGTIGALTTHAAFAYYIRHSRWRDIVGK